MPIGFLVSVLVITWATICSLAPARRPRGLATFSRYSALVVNELPIHAAAWVVACCALALAQGEAGTVPGQIVLAVAAATLVGLAVVVSRQRWTRAAIARALNQGLGSAAAEHPRPRHALSVLLTPLALGHRNVERIPDLSYGPAGERNLLDVYCPRTGRADGPTLVYFHGGGFVGGHKRREARPLFLRLASAGWVCVSANYRLKPAAAFPAPLVDVKRVIAWVRRHGPDHGADPDRIVLAGSSAGAFLAALAALTPNDRELQAGFEDDDTTVAAVVCLGGYYGFVDSDTPMAASPHAHVGPAPPFLIAHGALDTLVDPGSARRFAGDLRRVSPEPVVHVELPGAHHTFDVLRSLRFEAVIDGIEAFTTVAVPAPRQGRCGPSDRPPKDHQA